MTTSPTTSPHPPDHGGGRLAAQDVGGWPLLHDSRGPVSCVPSSFPWPALRLGNRRRFALPLAGCPLLSATSGTLLHCAGTE